MGQLFNGKWGSTPIPASAKGEFSRAEASFRNWVTADGAPGSSGTGGFKAESGRYHIYVSLACPWAHRTLMFRALKDLEAHIEVSVVSPRARNDGWTFDDTIDGATGDKLF